MEIDTPDPQQNNASFSKVWDVFREVIPQVSQFSSEPTTHTLAKAFSRPELTPLHIYRAACHLPERALREVVQILTFEPSDVAPTAARLLSIMRGLPGNLELAILFFQTHVQSFNSFDPRVKTFFSFIIGPLLLSMCDWGPILRNAVGGDCAESKLALSCLYDLKIHEPIEPVTHIHEWDSELEHENAPSFWRELRWASFTRLSSSCVSTTWKSSKHPIDGVVSSLPISYGDVADHYVRIGRNLLPYRSTTSGFSRSKASSGIKSNPDGKVLRPLETVIITQSVRHVIEDISDHLAFGVSFILEGPTGCGKTTILSYLAKETFGIEARRSDISKVPGVTFIQMDNAMVSSDGDSFTSLVGEIVPLPEGGGFTWRPGPIGVAAQRGDWIVFENMSRGEQNMSSALPVLLQLANAQPGDLLDAPGRGEPIRIANGFRCIATRSTSQEHVDNSWQPPGGWQTWKRVHMQGLSVTEKVDLLKTRFSSIQDCMERVVATVDETSSFVERTRGTLMKPPTMREAIRICNRLKAARHSCGTLSVENALRDSYDVLGASCCASYEQGEVLKILSNAWSLSPEIARDVCFKHRPTVLRDQSLVTIGRAMYESKGNKSRQFRPKLAMNGHTSRLLEIALRSLQMQEHVLLVGEAGSGKTSVVQELASLLNQDLVVVNLSRQSDIGDLIGGFKPIEFESAVPALGKRFEHLFCQVMSKEKNIRFLDALQRACSCSRRYERATRLMRGALKAFPTNLKTADQELLREWDSIAKDLANLNVTVTPAETICDARVNTATADDCEEQSEPPRKRPRSSPSHGGNSCEGSSSPTSGITKGKKRLEFSFSEGVLVKAMREGKWILLDEINLAPSELLERLVSVMDRGEVALGNESGSVVSQAPGFFLFGAMNPPTDIGKRYLPDVLRTRFSEIYVGDMTEREDITDLVMARFFRIHGSANQRGFSKNERLLANDISSFYIQSSSLAREKHIEDNMGRPIIFSIRTLSRMLDFAKGVRTYIAGGLNAIRRTLYEGALLAFCSSLPAGSRSRVMHLAKRFILGDEDEKRVSFSQVARTVSMNEDEKRQFKIVEGYPIEIRNTPVNIAEIQTFVVSTAGPTAAGKTSMVAYLACLTGNKLIRINNHEHTDLSEYIGGYVATESGSLEFSEGPLVKAARRGDWVMLDELNLAPPDVLESLNRLLDDNREIFIPETGETVKAASGFRLFATQNPPGLYGGRKELSKAFLSRFVEIRVEELPDKDLLFILEKRSGIPQSFTRKMVAVMRELQVKRKCSGLFSGREGFVTARDLFRWASRHPRSKMELAIHGFFLLGERCRLPSEREIVRNVVIKHTEVLPEVLSDQSLYSLGAGLKPSNTPDDSLLHSLQLLSLTCNHLKKSLLGTGIALTPTTRRMLTLVVHGMANNEPILLVGTTGGGKTTTCSAVCDAMSQKLLTVNCHRHTESSDLLGGFRPVRSRSSNKGVFEWCDGPLVQAMRQGCSFLIDEINMAEDAVIERLNSVLEPHRTLLLSERGAISNVDNSQVEPEQVQGHSNFRILATMNPGGDYGKRELSPALRNRFTEVWIPRPDRLDDFVPIVESRLQNLLRRTSNAEGEDVTKIVLQFLEQSLRVQPTEKAFSSIGLEQKAGMSFHVSLRDLSTWCDFIVSAVNNCKIDPVEALMHGSRVVFLDGLSVGATNEEVRAEESRIWYYLLSLTSPEMMERLKKCRYDTVPEIDFKVNTSSEKYSVKVGRFLLHRNTKTEIACPDRHPTRFCFKAPGTTRNIARLTRALAVTSRPILLEGPPGSGKSSLISALADLSGNQFIRINLSESTEMSDLIGMDAPDPVKGSFRFQEGPLLTAMKRGSWILLDELNLASQSVLEGLNSVLDHRRVIFVPETNEAVPAHKFFRVFGAQNPVHGGGGRRGLPQSFLNRFTRVIVDAPSSEDILCIIKSVYNMIPENVSKNIVRTLALMKENDSFRYESFTDYGLRDALRWCDVMCRTIQSSDAGRILFHSKEYLRMSFDVAVLQGLREGKSHEVAEAIFEKIYGFEWRGGTRAPSLKAAGASYRIGFGVLHQLSDYYCIRNLEPLSGILNIMQLRALQAMAIGIEARWPIVLLSGANVSADGFGKRMVQFLGMSCGKKITTFHGSSLVDAETLVGGYSQRGGAQCILQIIGIAHELLRIMIRSCARSDQTVFGKDKRADLVGKAQERFLRMCVIHSEGTDQHSSPWRSHGVLQLHQLEEFASEAEDFLQSARLLLQDIESTGNALESMASYSNEVRRMASQQTFRSPFIFEWKKSKLVKAIERGDWIFIQGAEMCPPAVLDRLNPLFERPPVSPEDLNSSFRVQQRGRVLLAEAPSKESGSPIYMSPHPDFQIFFAVSGRCSFTETQGLSRPLLDRSLRICLDNRLSEKQVVTRDDTNTLRPNAGLLGMHPELSGPIHMEMLTDRAEMVKDTKSSLLFETRLPISKTSADFVLHPELFCLDIDLCIFNLITRERKRITENATKLILLSSESILNDMTCSSRGCTSKGAAKFTKAYEHELSSAVSEAIMLASASESDMSLRTSYMERNANMFSIARSKHKNTFENVAGKLLSIRFSVGDKSSLSCSLDPLYAMDRIPMEIMSFETNVSLKKKCWQRAIFLRGQILAFHRFEEVWKNASLISRPRSVLAQTRLKWQIHSAATTGSDADTGFDVMCFELLASAASNLELTRRTLMEANGWEHPFEVEVYEIYDKLSKICEIMVRDETHTTRLWALLHSISRVGEKLCRVTNIDLLGFSVLRRLVPQILNIDVSIKWLTSSPNLAFMPRSRLAQMAEKRFRNVFGSPMSHEVTPNDVDVIVRGISTLSSRIIDDNTEIINKMTNLADSLEPRLDSSQASDWNRALSLFRSIVRVLTVTSMQDCFASLLDDSRGFSHGSAFSTSMAIKSLWDMMRCTPLFSLESLVAIKRFSWLLESPHIGINGNDLETKYDSNEQDLFLLAILWEIDGRNELISYRDPAGVTEDSSPFEAVIDYLRVPQRYLFWNLRAVYHQAAVTSGLFAHNSSLCDITTDSSLNVLLLATISALRHARSESKASEVHQRILNGNIKDRMAHFMSLVENFDCDKDGSSSSQVGTQKDELIIYYTVTAFKSSSTVERNNFENFRSRGVAWIAIGVHRLNAYFHILHGTKANDPSKFAEERAILSLETKIKLEARKKAYSLLQKNRLGGDEFLSSKPAQTFSHQLQVEEENLRECTSSYVYRNPDDADFESYMRLVEAAKSNIVDIIKRSSFIQRAKHFKRSQLLRLVPEALHLTHICKAMGERLALHGDHFHFRDLSLRLRLGIQEIHHGLQWLLRVTEITDLCENPASSKRIRVLSDLCLLPRASFKGSFKLPDAFSQCAEIAPSGKVLMTIAQFLVENDSFESNNTATHLSEFFSRIVKVWKISVVQSETEAMKRNSLHVIRQSSQQNELESMSFIEVSEDQEIEDFISIFNPVRDEVEDELLGLQPEYDSCSFEQRMKDDTNPDARENIPEINSSDFWNLHQSIFPGKECPSLMQRGPSIEPDADTLLSFASDISALIPEGAGPALGTIVVNGVWGFLCSQSVTRNLGGHQSLVEKENWDSNQGHHYNFYKDSNVQEVQRASGALFILKAYIENIQRIFFKENGNHPVLEGISTAIDRVARVSTTQTPLSVVVIGLENILRKADEWNRLFASRDTKLNAELIAVSRLVSRWRGIEMASWPLLLADRKRRFEAQAEKWTLLLYDAIINESLSSDKAEDEKVKILLSTVDQFLRSSPSGEFCRRLAIVLSISHHLLSLDDHRTGLAEHIGRGLRGVCRFYQLFADHLEKQLSQQYEAVLKELREFTSIVSYNPREEVGSAVKMAKGNDKNLDYFRLKALSEKTRRRIHKLCLKVDTTLRVPFYKHMSDFTAALGFSDPEMFCCPPTDESSLPHMSDCVSVLKTSSGHAFFSKTEMVSKSDNVISLPALTKLLARFDTLRARLVNYGREILNTRQTKRDSITDFSPKLRKVIRLRVGKLRELKLGNDVQPKRRALIELLKGLFKAGLSPFEKPHTNLTLDLLSTGDPSSCEMYNKIANNLYFSGVHQYQALRTVSDSSTRNNDISPEEAIRMRAFCRDMLEKAAIERKELNRCSVIALWLSKMAHSSVNTNENILVPNNGSATQFARLRETLLRLRKVKATLRQVSNIMKEAQKSVSRSVDLVKGERGLDKMLAFCGKMGENSLQELQAVLNSCCDMLGNEPTAVALMDLDDDQHQDLKYFDGRFQRWCDGIHAYLLRLSESLKNWLSRAQAISKHNIVTELLSPLRSLVEVDIGENVEESLPLSSGKSSSAAVGSELYGSLCTNAEQLVETMLISSQKAMAWNGMRERTRNSDERELSRHADETDLFITGALKKGHDRTVSLSDYLLLSRIKVQFETNAQTLKRLLPQRRLLSLQGTRELIGMQKALGLILKEYLDSMLLPSIEKARLLHRENLSLLRTLTSLFVGVCADGFCRPTLQEESNGMMETELKSGTGFGDVGDGDLSGAQNVSDAVEDEEQLLGLQEEGNKEQQNENESNGEDNGFEMTTDFDGDLHDTDNKHEHDMEGNGDAEKKMGQEHGTGENILNEKLWDSESENNNEHESELDSKHNEKGNKSPSNAIPGEWAVGDRKDENHLNNIQEQNGNEGESVPDVSMVDETKEPAHEESDEPDNLEAEASLPKEHGINQESRDTEENSERSEGQLEDLAEQQQEGCREKKHTMADVPNVEVAQGHELDPNQREGDHQDVDDVEPDGGSPMVGVDDEPEVHEFGKLDEDYSGDFPENCELSDPEGVHGENENIEPADQSSEPVEEDHSSYPKNAAEEETMENSSVPANLQDGEDRQNLELEHDTNELDGSEFNMKQQTSEVESHAKHMLPGLSTTGQADKNMRDDSEPFANQGQGTLSFGNDKNEMDAQENDGRSYDFKSGSGAQKNAENGTGRDSQLRSSAEQDEMQKQGSSSISTNPLRLSDPKDLIREWEDYLRAIRDEDERLPKETEGQSRAGSWQYETIDDKKEDHQHALGAACEEQQRPLPDEEALEMNNRNAEGRETEAFLKPGQAISGERSQESKLHHEQLSTTPDSNESLQNPPREDMLQPHPARAAVSAEQESNAVASSKQISGSNINVVGTKSKLEPDDFENGEDPMSEACQRVRWKMESLDHDQAKELWGALESKVASQAATLCEKLRLVLEPTKASRMAGGYRTGKRLNMRRVIEYVASDFRKDRIWLRRVKPDKRSYDILVAIDDSASMVESEAGAMAIESLTLLLSALAKLEVGRVAVASFGSSAKLVRHFEEPLPISIESGAKLLQNFTFSQTETNIVNLLSFIYSQMGLMNNERALESVSLAFIISDGRLSDREEVRRQLRRLKESNVLVAFFILDRRALQENSIFNVQRVEYETNGKMSLKPYMHDFPVDFYAVVQNMRSLPGILADALRQWVEVTNYQ
ncbi:unnamed protein product [Agarophyton chilense]